MNKIQSLVMVGAIATMAVSSANASSTNLIKNGSFENVNPQFSDPGAFSYIPLFPDNEVIAPDQLISNWTVTDSDAPSTIPAGIDWIQTYWLAQDGVRSVDMSGTPGPGAVSQAFKTWPGHVYTVSFYMSGNPDGAPSIKTMTVDTAGVDTAGVETAGTTQTFTYNTALAGNSDADMKWAPHSFNFTAINWSTKLTFTSQDAGNGNAGAALDNVSAVQLPPTDKHQCFKSGWRAYTDPAFKNQGQCVKYVVHLGKAPHGNN
jgi:choice-of-anchor C domain-containing protein